MSDKEDHSPRRDSVYHDNSDLDDDYRNDDLGKSRGKQGDDKAKEKATVNMWKKPARSDATRNVKNAGKGKDDKGPSGGKGKDKGDGKDESESKKSSKKSKGK